MKIKSSIFGKRGESGTRRTANVFWKEGKAPNTENINGYTIKYGYLITGKNGMSINGSGEKDRLRGNSVMAYCKNSLLRRGGTVMLDENRRCDYCNYYTDYSNKFFILEDFFRWFLQNGKIV